jgi:hypothetical protein
MVCSGEVYKSFVVLLRQTTSGLSPSFGWRIKEIKVSLGGIREALALGPLQRRLALPKSVNFRINLRLRLMVVYLPLPLLVLASLLPFLSFVASFALPYRLYNHSCMLRELTLSTNP